MDLEAVEEVGLHVRRVRRVREVHVAQKGGEAAREQKPVHEGEVVKHAQVELKWVGRARMDGGEDELGDCGRAIAWRRAR